MALISYSGSVYNSGNRAIIESLYLNRSLTSDMSEANIFVNPDGSYYLENKVVIFTNSNNLDIDYIDSLYRYNDVVFRGRLKEDQIARLGNKLESRYRNCYRDIRIRNMLIIFIKDEYLSRPYNNVDDLVFVSEGTRRSFALVVPSNINDEKLVSRINKVTYTVNNVTDEILVLKLFGYHLDISENG